MPIKPENITKEQAERFAELMDADFGRFLNDYQAIPIDKFANALIEAGIVSPPVWVIRYTDGPDNGRLAASYCDGYFHIADKKQKLLDGEVYEHWKGQAE